MRTFRVRIFENNGNWFFRWDNVHVPTVCGVTMPLRTKQEAESQKKDFIEAERIRHPWTVFESA